MKLEDAFLLIRNGVSIKQYDNASGIPITRIETISNRVVDRNKCGYADVFDIEKYQDYVLQDGDILMSHINSVQHLGKTALYNKIDGEVLIHGMNLLVLRPKREILEPNYAYIALNSLKFLRQLPRITKKSVNQASFSVNDLKQTDIDVPSISKQKEIAHTVMQIDRMIANRQQALSVVDELVKSRFVEMFGDPVTNPMGWEVLSWQDVFDTTTGKLDSNAAVDGGQYPFFTCAKEPFTIDIFSFDCEALLLAGNNAAGIYDVKHYKGKFNAYQRTYVLQLKNNEWKYEFFKHQLEGRLVYLQNQSVGTNTKYLTLGILNRLKFIVPNITMQGQFADFVAQTDKSKLAVQQSIETLQTLKAKLMQDYFG